MDGQTDGHDRPDVWCLSQGSQLKGYQCSVMNTGPQEGRMAPAPFSLTQGVEDPSHEVEAHKHGHPASRPQAPCFHGIALLFSTKHLLYDKVAWCQDPQTHQPTVWVLGAGHCSLQSIGRWANLMSKSLPIWLKNMNKRSMALVHGLTILLTAAVHMGHLPPFWVDSLKHMLVLGEALALNPRTLLAVSGPLTPTVPSYSVGCTFVPHCCPWFSFWPVNANILCLLLPLCPGPHAPHTPCACTQT